MARSSDKPRRVILIATNWDHYRAEIEPSSHRGLFRDTCTRTHAEDYNTALVVEGERGKNDILRRQKTRLATCPSGCGLVPVTVVASVVV
jgi:hypothetical protein